MDPEITVYRDGGLLVVEISVDQTEFVQQFRSAQAAADWLADEWSGELVTWNLAPNVNRS